MPEGNKRLRTLTRVDIPLKKYVNTMDAYALAPCGARSLETMVSTKAGYEGSLLSKLEGFQLP